MSNVGEWTSMHKDRGSFEGLHEGRHESILHQDRECTTTAKVVGCDRITAPAGADNHGTEALSHVVQRSSKGEDRHDLATDGDVIVRVTLEFSVLLCRSGDSDRYRS